MRIILLQHAQEEDGLQGKGNEKVNEQDKIKKRKYKEQDKDQDNQQKSDGKEAADHRNVY